MVTTQIQEPPARRAFRKIVAKVSAMIPKNYPPDDEYWRLTYDAHDAFMDAVRACEAEDTPEARDRVRSTAQAWETAWARQIAAWREDQKWAYVRTGK